MRTLQIRRRVEDLWIKEFTTPDIAAALNMSERAVWRYLARIREDYAKWTAQHETEIFRKQVESINLVIREAWLTYYGAKTEDINGKVGCLNTIAKLLSQRGEILGLDTQSSKTEASMLYTALQKKIEEELGVVQN